MPRIYDPWAGYKATGIDGKTVANTTIFTTDIDTPRFHVRQVMVVPTTVSGAGVAPIVSVGITAATFVDIVAAVSLPATAAESIIIPALVANQASIASNTAVVCRVSTAATGFTTFTFRVYVLGFYD